MAHKNDTINSGTAAQISALTAKTLPTGSDVAMIEDAAASDAKKKVTLSNLAKGLDFNGQTAKAVPVTADVILIADSAASFAVKKCTLADIPFSGTDSTAVHDNVAAEISAVTAKAVPVDADMLLIEDSAAGNAKKMITIGSIVPAGVLGGTLSAVTLDDGTIDGGKLATCASGATPGTGLCVHVLTLTSGANGDQTLVVDDKIEVVDFYCIPNGAGTAGSTVTLKNGSNAITNALNLNVSDNVKVGASTIDDAQSTVAAAGTLTFSKASDGGNFPGARAVVLSVRKA